MTSHQPSTSSTFVIVRLVPSSAMNPLCTTYRMTLSRCSSRGRNRNVTALPSAATRMISAVVSTWPCTKCPPIRVSARTARSRFTRESLVSCPRFVSRSVSGAMPTLKLGAAASDEDEEEEESHVAVRQTPLMAMLSPRAASSRSFEDDGSAMVSEVPPVSS
ncbi:hypothetical protein RRF57_000091 [Xylaria bambusicola]|uniref:Uncharacterized protein n=1 Tax=Xylaria bambusicola TaxID=326684 RepID=A0AAN7U317_9PEZI